MGHGNTSSNAPLAFARKKAVLARDGPRGRFLVKVQACQRCIYTHAEKLILVHEGLNASGVVGAHVQNARGASSARA